MHGSELTGKGGKCKKMKGALDGKKCRDGGTGRELGEKEGKLIRRNCGT